MHKAFGVIALALMLVAPGIGALAQADVVPAGSGYDVRVDVNEPDGVNCNTRTEKQNSYTWKVYAKCDNKSNKTKDVTLKGKLKYNGDVVDKCKRTDRIKAGRTNYEFSCTVSD